LGYCLVYFCFFSLFRDAKTGNWRVYLEDGEVRQPAKPVKAGASVSSKSFGIDNHHGTQLSFVLKNKSATSTDQCPQRVCDIAKVTVVTNYLSLCKASCFTVKRN